MADADLNTGFLGGEYAVIGSAGGFVTRHQILLLVVLTFASAGCVTYKLRTQAIRNDEFLAEAARYGQFADIPVAEELEMVPVRLAADKPLPLSLYENEVTRDHVGDFYTEIAGDAEIAELILENAYKNEIPFNLAFALAWVESRFRIDAVNRNLETADRGVFQLNSDSFPHLSEEDFFNPRVNIREGLAYLRYCLDQGGNEVVALAMYNAGKRRVTTKGAPLLTLNYIDKVFAYRSELDIRFEEQFHEALERDPGWLLVKR